MTTVEGMSLVISRPDKIVPYPIAGDEVSKGALYLYGNPSSSKIAILCAGYADDHTVFLPFAKALADQGNSFVGVMCIPGFDDRPEDDAPWTSHKKNGYTFEEWANTVRDAVKVLRQESTCNNGSFTGIFHDWGCVAGVLWTNRAIAESTVTGFKPNAVVCMDVLPPPNPKASNIPKVARPSLKQTICYNLYQSILASTFFLNRFVSRYLSIFTLISSPYPRSGFLQLLRLGPCYDFDINSTTPLYKQTKPINMRRLCYMAYPYFNMYKAIFTGILSKIFRRPIGSTIFTDFVLHLDLKSTPVLYMYGTKKRTNFHENTTVKMLQLEEKEKNSLSKTVAVPETGHFFYVQKPDMCVQTVIDFMDDTSATKTK